MKTQIFKLKEWIKNFWKKFIFFIYKIFHRKEVKFLEEFNLKEVRFMENLKIDDSRFKIEKCYINSKPIKFEGQITIDKLK